MRKLRTLSMVLVLVFSLSVISGACTEAPKSNAEFYAENRVTTITPDVATSTTAYANRIFAAYWPDETGGGQLLAVFAAKAVVTARHSHIGSSPVPASMVCLTPSTR